MSVGHPSVHPSVGDHYGSEEFKGLLEIRFVADISVTIVLFFKKNIFTQNITLFIIFSNILSKNSEYHKLYAAHCSKVVRPTGPTGRHIEFTSQTFFPKNLC